jgi:hypothetical protein
LTDNCGSEVTNRLTKLETTQVASDKALQVALAEMNRRLTEMNEFRAQIQQERNLFLTTKEYMAQHEAFRFRIDSIDRWKSNMEGRMWMLGAALVFFNILIGFGVNLLFHYWK